MRTARQNAKCKMHISIRGSARLFRRSIILHFAFYILHFALPSSAQVREPTALQFVGANGPHASYARVELGEVDPITRPMLKESFRLRNVSNTAVRVTRVQSSCGCTSVTLGGQNVEEKAFELGPNQETVLEAIHDFYLIRPGQMSKYIWLYLNNERRASAMVEISLNLKPCVRFYPDSLVFGRVKAGERRAMRIEVEVDRRLLPASGKLPALTCSDRDMALSPTGPSTKRTSDTVRRAYSVVLSPRASLGVHFALLSFPPSTGGGPTVDPKKLIIAQVSAGVQAVVEGRVVVNPAIALFGTVEKGEEHTLALGLQGKDAMALKGLRMEAAAAWLSARVIPSADPLKATLELKMGAAAPAGTLQTQVVIWTATGERLVLPVTVTVEPQPGAQCKNGHAS